MAGTDIFSWLDALWTKKHPEGSPPIFMMYRFIAADKDFAPYARYLQVDLNHEPDLAFRTWQGLLPRGQGAPRFSYVAPKKPPAAEELTTRMVQVLGERRKVVEEMQAVMDLVGKTRELYLHFGIEPPGEEAEEAEEQVRPTSGGLMDAL